MTCPSACACAPSASVRRDACLARPLVRLLLSASPAPRPLVLRSAVVQLRVARGCVAGDAGAARVWPRHPTFRSDWCRRVTSPRYAVLIYVGVYSLYVQKSYQAVSDYVAATEIRLQGYVSDTSNRVRAHDTRTELVHR